MKNILNILATLALVSCNNSDNEADAYGNFESTEVTISAESNGKIEFLNLDEGIQLEKNAIIGQIDTVQLYLNKKQLLASKSIIYSKSANILSQRNVLQEQL
jgi:HlyD family secretion protein